MALGVKLYPFECIRILFNMKSFLHREVKLIQVFATLWSTNRLRKIYENENCVTRLYCQTEKCYLKVTVNSNSSNTYSTKKPRLLYFALASILHVKEEWKLFRSHVCLLWEERGGEGNCSQWKSKAAYFPLRCGAQ